MKDIKRCFSTKMIIIVAALIIGAGAIGIGGGAKYLNKSQTEYTKIVNLKKQKIEKIQELTSQISKLKITIAKKDERIGEMKSWKNNKSFVMVNRGLLETNLKHYSKLSSANRKIILDTVIAESTKYNINPIILYSLLHVESSMRFWIQHTPVNIIIKKKKRRIQAVGLGGVVWEWWGDKLKVAGIAEVRSDLFNPEVNIKSAAFILNEFSKMDKLKGTKSKDESMLRRYFGGNFKSYSDKIDKKVMSIVRPNLYRY